MRTLQDYKNIYREIATNLNLQGDSVEMIIQLLSYASYIEENENIVYSQESSLERASLINSKIQLCVNEMYSVYRGQCPRVLINIRPQKYFNFQPFDEIVSSNNFRIYYLGWVEPGTGQIFTNTGEGVVSLNLGSNDYDYHYGSKVVNPADDEELTVIGLLAPGTISMTWTLDSDNLYYVDCTENNLSNDMYASKNNNMEAIEVTREFAKHVLDGALFDLTLPSFGSRLYTGKMDPSTVINATYFKYSQMSSYNTSELKKINIRGAELVEFEDNKWNGIEEFISGVVFLNETKPDDLNTIHYKAYRDRFVNTIIRSNSDIGELLREAYPEKVLATNYKFDFSTPEEYDIIIYYIPQEENNELTDDEINEFRNTRGAYYVTKKIWPIKGTKIRALFNIDLELYKNSDTIALDVVNIISTYGNKFDVDIRSELNTIRSLISKISEVKEVSKLDVTYINPESGELISTLDNVNLEGVYFDIDYDINTTVTTKS